MEFKLIEPEEVSRSAPPTPPSARLHVDLGRLTSGSKVKNRCRKKHKFEISGSVNLEVGRQQRRVPPDLHVSLLLRRFSLVSTRCHRSSSSLTDRIEDLGRFSRRNFRLNSHKISIRIIQIFRFFKCSGIFFKSILCFESGVFPSLQFPSRLSSGVCGSVCVCVRVYNLCWNN